MIDTYCAFYVKLAHLNTFCLYEIPSNDDEHTFFTGWTIRCQKVPDWGVHPLGVTASLLLSNPPQQAAKECRTWCRWCIAILWLPRPPGHSVRGCSSCSISAILMNLLMHCLGMKGNYKQVAGAFDLTFSYQ